MNKRGLNDVITALILIILLLAAIVIIWTLIRPLLIDTSENIDVEQFKNNFKVETKYGFGQAARGYIMFSVKNLKDNEILGYYIILEDIKGKTVPLKMMGSEAALKISEVKIYKIDYPLFGLSDIRKISIRPIYTLYEKEKISSLSFDEQTKSFGLVDGHVELYYKFDNNNNVGEIDSAVYDWSRSGKTGTINGAVYDPDGIVDKSLYFGGTSEVTIPDSLLNDFNGEKDYTWIMWVKRDNANIFDGLINRGAPVDPPVGGYSISLSLPAQICLFAYVAPGKPHGEQGVCSSDTISTDWTHIAVVYESKKVKFYKNGNPAYNIIEDLEIGNNVQSDIQIGAGRFFGLSGNLAGKMDELLIFNRSLTSEEIKDLYESYE